MKKILNLFFNRTVITVFLILFQLSILALIVWKVSEYFVYLNSLFIFLSICVVVYIVSRQDNPTFKMAWVIPVLIFPVFGGLFYLIFGGNKMSRKLKKLIDTTYQETKDCLVQDESIIDEIYSQNKSVGEIVTYLKNHSFFPIYKNTETEYLSPGEKFYEKLIEELKEAKHYIFMEYFIISEGVMWDTILGILTDKAKEGVDVRIIYDDVGCIGTLPPKYNKVLESLNIKSVIFNPFVPILSSVFNNRDHRKITVIDGNTTFTGGINLADEYINKKVRFGHWKDAAIMIKGDASWNFTIMFLRVWSALTNEKTDYMAYRPFKHIDQEIKNDGFVQPYGDSPYDGELIGESVYLYLINKATEYVYICTPYLIIDNELSTALILASKGGIDVRIVTPYIEDKPYVHMVTRANYTQLIKAGIRIYEYTPGFIHSKTFVSDDQIGTVGTINLDYRSLYLHFECGVLLYKNSSVLKIKEDFLSILKKSKEISLEDTKKVTWMTRIIRAILKVFSPLM